MNQIKKTLALLAFLLFPLYILGQEPFYFVQFTDPQLGMINSNKDFRKETSLMENAVQAINRLSPRFVVVTGDLVNDGSSNEQIKEFKRLCGLIHKNIPVYLTPGNHDLGQKATDESLKKYKDNYGYDCFSFKINGTCFIGINTPIIWADRVRNEDKQYQWMQNVLKKSQKCNHRIVFGHHPVFVKEAGEPDKYENFPAIKRTKYLDLFSKYRVEQMFAGHLHHNSYGETGNFKMTTTSALGMQIGKDQSGIRIIKVYPNRIESEYYPLDSIPQQVTL